MDNEYTLGTIFASVCLHNNSDIEPKIYVAVDLAKITSIGSGNLLIQFWNNTITFEIVKAELAKAELG